MVVYHLNPYQAKKLHKPGNLKELLHVLPGGQDSGVFEIKSAH